jgi:hypothetical protein
MTSLSLPDGSNALWLDQAPQCLRLEPAFDGARITVELKAWAQSAPQDQIPVRVTATLLAGQSSNPSEMRALAMLSPKRLIYSQASPTQLTLSGSASAQALREVEEEREGGNLWLVLGAWPTTEPFWALASRAPPRCRPGRFGCGSADGAANNRHPAQDWLAKGCGQDKGKTRHELILKG